MMKMLSYCVQGWLQGQAEILFKCSFRKDKRVQEDDSLCNSEDFKSDDEEKKSKQKRRIVQSTATWNTPVMTPTVEVSLRKKFIGQLSYIQYSIKIL